MTLTQERERTVAWFKQAYSALSKAGGVPDLILERVPDDVLHTLIANNIHLIYTKE